MTLQDKLDFEQRAAADRAELEAQAKERGVALVCTEPARKLDPALAVFLVGTVVGVIGLAVGVLPLAGLGFAVAGAGIHRLGAR
ncbi:MAG: hypothetical protein H0T42_04070 [Deltaproteobacteria bacterium]|nr:hypothetical protein [Deltaproteobacteria bacterium]